ncbi:thioredoxin family protein [Candidatus Woesebacteria bacterium]|nr:thioredoxin family protein [Candidatus Woesebacteria bacterium]
MNNSKIIIVVFAIIVFGMGGFMYLRTANKAETVMNEEDVMMEDEEKMEDTTGGAMMKKDESESMMEDSSYVEYSKDALMTASEGRRVLFFYASWCPTCIPADADFKANAAQLPDDVTVVRVNYNDPETDQEEKDLAEKYGITYQHTFVQIDFQGNEVAKWNGGGTEELLKKLDI